MADFGIACESRQKGQMLMKLNQWLLERYQAGERDIAAIQAWNAAQVYQRAIALMGRQIDGGE